MAWMARCHVGCVTRQPGSALGESGAAVLIAVLLLVGVAHP